MKVKFIEEPNGLNLTKDKIYDALSIDKDEWYIIINDENEKQAYFQRRFVIVEDMCEYCNEQNIEISENAFQGSDGILFNKREEKYYLVIEHFRGERNKVEIKFCPMCGRKL